MLDILREAEEQFQNIHKLLISRTDRNSDYFTHLSIATEEAYVTMNEGMCANTTVCHQCAEHRNFIRSMLEVLNELESGAPLSPTYEEKLNFFSSKVNDILNKISAVIVTL